MHGYRNQRYGLNVVLDVVLLDGMFPILKAVVANSAAISGR